MNFRKSLIKLTIGYLCLIMLVSFLFSFVVYRVAPVPLHRRLDVGGRIVHEDVPPPHFRPRVDRMAVEEVKRGIAVLLVYLNIGVLCLGGLLSYALARRELKPMEEALELQNRFTSDAAHELRTPLTAMKAEIEVALRAGALQPDEARKLLESNLEEIEKLELLSGALLKLARYEVAEEAAEARTVPAGEIAGEAVEKLGGSASAKGSSIDLETEEGVLVYGDRVSLVEMLVILLDNSIKYSGRDTSVTVSVGRDRQHAVIRVRDEGYGIRGQDLEHVFDRFYRGSLPGSKVQVEGYGLGLPIAKRIAEVQGGDIELASVPGVGTTATVRLPLASES